MGTKTERSLDASLRGNLWHIRTNCLLFFLPFVFLGVPRNTTGKLEAVCTNAGWGGSRRRSDEHLMFASQVWGCFFGVHDAAFFIRHYLHRGVNGN